MKLKRLLKDILIQQVKGSKDITLTGLCANSKLVAPGNLFIAKKGQADDGMRYIPEAVEAGAAAILTDMYDPSFKQVVQLIHPNVKEVEASLAAEYYQHPSDELFMVAITGTNGKTTTSFIIKHLLDRLKGPCGLIGTIEYIVGNHRYQATRTTPDVISNHRLLREMINQGCQSAVMEVTSHALDQGRVDKIDYDVAIFTNLTAEHLDYHHSMEKYCQTKKQLFTHLGRESRKKKGKKTAIINSDSPWAKQIIDQCSAQILTYGIDDKNADLYASDIRLGNGGTELTIHYQGRSVLFNWTLIGRFNVYNCLGAIAMVLSQGYLLEDLAEKMSLLPAVKGRLEPVRNELGFKIYVDFAHSDDSLVNVLQTLNELKTKRIITVFGCGGDRDRAKRSRMAAASERYSDFSILTSDNPRTEDPNQICQEASKGFSKSDYLIEVDRRLAIQKAIEMAKADDIVLIAGKGHENYQIFAHKTIEFDDCKIASDICVQLKNRQTAHC